MSNRKITETVKLEIKELYDSGLNFTQIQDIKNICRKKISKIIKSHYTDKCFKNKSNVDPNIFKDLTDRDLNYFLGLIATDGCIHSSNRIELALKESDLQIIELFKKFLGDKVNITEKYKKIEGKIFKGYRIAFRSQEIFDLMLSYGITPNKSKTLNISIPINIDFLRGVIDGDGSWVAGKRLNILSASKPFIIQISDFLDSLNIRYTIGIVKRKSNIYSLNVSYQEDLILLIDLLYKDTSTFIERKYYTAQQMRNRLCNMRQIRGTSVRNPEPRLDSKENI